MAHTEQPLSKLLKDDSARLVLDYQGKFDSMLKTVKDEICELKTSALESELHISKTVIYNLKTLIIKYHEYEQYSRRQ